jgi:FkbH-like protein
MKLTIAATFTVEPIEPVLAFWLGQRGMSLEVELAPYNQIFQQLLDPSSVLGRSTGINVLLIRLCDWSKDRANIDRAAIAATANELASILKASTGASRSWIICFCPSAGEHQAIYCEIEDAIAVELGGTAGVSVVTSTELLARYPVTEWADRVAESQGQIPYTRTFFAALGTQIARLCSALVRSPHKVIVLDCDNTLWSGVCGEDGPAGIILSAPFLALQRFMLRQSEQGMLLCLCSKNSDDDVWDVFAQRTDLVLKREHFAGTRINWTPKSQNIAALAAELKLGLDSFIFVDDNAIECAEVKANLPQVHVVQLPTDVSAIARTLDHVWAFDRLNVTQEDRARANMYREEVMREQVRRSAPSYTEFISKLALTIHIDPLRPEQLPRASQLTRRTNQFNCSALVRSEAEISGVLADKSVCLSVEVSDRFGAYGFVGLVIAQPVEDRLVADCFLLSCRALGRGVEHRMLAKLGSLARERSLQEVEIVHRKTPRNRPARQFLDSLAIEPIVDGELERFRLRAEVASALRFDPNTAAPGPDEAAEGAKATPATKSSSDWLGVIELAQKLQDPIEIEDSMASRRSSVRSNLTPYAEPRTKIEEMLVTAWCDILSLDKVGIHDDVLELGADSIIFVQMSSRVSELLQAEIPVPLLLDNPTVAQQAAALAAVVPALA